MDIELKNGNFSINGSTFSGRNIKIENGEVIVDGVKQDLELNREINVVVNGDCDRIENANGDVTAQNVRSITTGNGDVRCGDVSGSVSTGTGDVNCGNVGGSINSGVGDIYHK